MTATVDPVIAGEPCASRRVSRGAGSLAALASELGCESAAIALLHPFLVDGKFVTVLASAVTHVWSADLLRRLSAANVRPLRAEEIVLGFQLARPQSTAYMEEALLEHEELMLNVDPPDGYASSTPAAVRRALDAQVISLALPSPRL
jgi:hypothetical protein